MLPEASSVRDCREGLSSPPPIVKRACEAEAEGEEPVARHERVAQAERWGVVPQTIEPLRMLRRVQMPSVLESGAGKAVSASTAVASRCWRL